MKKASLRTSKDIYDRLKWDHAFPSEEVWIGYEDRRAGIKEIPFADFRPGGRIPWDRLQYFRLGEQRIWDRGSRLDRIFGSGDTPEGARLDAEISAAGFGSGFINRPIWRWEPLEAQWEPIRPASAALPDTIELLSLNILRTDYLADRIPHPAHIKALLEFLHQSPAQLIALQEVQPEFFQALLADVRFREGWYFSDGPEAETLGDLGILVMSRIRPQQVLEFRFPDLRPAMIMRFELGRQPLLVATVHLPSNRRENSPLLRQACIDQLTTALPETGPLILLGDFNFSDDGPETLPSEFRDLWLQLRPGEEGATFDPMRNPLASITSLRNLPLRLDRIFLRDPDSQLLPKGISLTATDPVLSDHYGLQAQIIFAESLHSNPDGKVHSAPTTHRSALCIIPPPEFQATIQSIRRRYDDRFERWMPHINLLYGFLPESLFAKAATLLREKLASVQPFQLQLNEISAFQHGNSDTLWLGPDEKGDHELQTLQEILLETFPQCQEQNRNGSFTPHLSLGKLHGTDRKELQSLLKEWNMAWAGLKFTVDRICLISRRDDEPFEIREEIGLAGSPKAWKVDLQAALGMSGWLPGMLHYKLAREMTEMVRRAHDQVQGAETLTVIGSAGLGTDLAGSDMDLLATGTLRRESYFGHLERLLRGASPKINLRRVEDALMPVLKIEWRGQFLDVQYTLADGKDPEHYLIMAGQIENKLLIKHLGSHLPQFQLVVRAFKTMARIRQMDDQAYGWPGGLAWALMVASVPPQSNAEAWLESALEHLIRHDWNQVLQMPGQTVPPIDEEAAMQIAGFAAPEANVTRYVSAGNLNHLTEMFLHAWDFAQSARQRARSWSDFFRVPREHFPAHLEIRFRAGTAVEMENCQGWWRRHVLSFIRHWEEQLPIVVRVFSSFEHPDQHTSIQRFGIDRWPNPAQQQIIHDLLSEMEEKFIGWALKPAAAAFSSQLVNGELAFPG